METIRKYQKEFKGYYRRVWKEICENSIMILCKLLRKCHRNLSKSFSAHHQDCSDIEKCFIGYRYIHQIQDPELGNVFLPILASGPPNEHF